MYSVYILTDPRDGQVRYVGISCNVERRYDEHINHDNHNRTKLNWIQGLKDAGLLPQFSVIESELPMETAIARERYWIRHYLNLGAPLTNISGVTKPWQGGIRQARPKKVRKPKRVYRKSTYLLIEEVASELRVHIDVVLKWLSTGELRGYKLGRKISRIKREDLEAFLEARRYRSDTKPENS